MQPTTTAPELPGVLLPYQQELVKACEPRRSVVVVEKSRRTGYTWTAACVAVLHAYLRAEAGGMDVLYMGYEQEMTREFIGYCADWAAAFNYAVTEQGEFLWEDPEHPERNVKAYRVRFASGFEIVALPSSPRAFRGKQGLAILDEAAFMDDLAGALKGALAYLMWGGKVMVLSTHLGDANPFNQLVQDIRARRHGRGRYELLRCTFEEAMQQGLYRRICLRTGEAWTAEGEAEFRRDTLEKYGDNADEELNCIPASGSGNWLPRTVIEARMQAGIPVIRWTLPRDFVHLPEEHRKAAVAAFCREELDPVLAKLDADRRHAFGWDFGRYHDLSVMLPYEIGRDLVRRAPFVLELRGVPSDEQQQVLWYVLDRLPRFTGKMDAGGAGFAIAENTMKRYGQLRVEMVMLTEPWYREHTPALKAAFEDGTLVLPRDDEIADDHSLVKMIRGVARVPDLRSGTTGKKRHGDSAVANMLAWAASCAEPAEYGYQAAGERAQAASQPARFGDEDDDDAPRRAVFTRQLRRLQ